MSVEMVPMLVVDGRPDTWVPGTLESELDGVEIDTAPTVEAARKRLDGVACVVSRVDVEDERGIELNGGFRLLDAVRERFPDLPFVLYAETGTEDLAQRGAAKGATDTVLRVSEETPRQLIDRIRPIVRRHRAERRAERQRRISDVVRRINQGLVMAESASGVSEMVVERLSEVEVYDGALFCPTDGPPVTAGTDGVDESELASHLRDLATDRERTARSSVPESAVESSGAVGRDGLFAVPVAFDDQRYGTLGILTETEIDDTEQQVLIELADTIAYALDAVETRASLRRQNERLDDFAAMVGHDLRSPLQVLSGQLELIAEACDTDHVEAATSATVRIERILDDMLSLARGSEAIDPGSVSIEPVAEEAWETVRARLEHGSEATLDVSDTTITADPDHLQQVFVNLFHNAIEHAGPTVSIRVFETEAGFAVVDDGPGIPAEDRDRIFEHGYTTDSEGTGYGLSIVARIADAHGWSVSVTDGEAGGARFEFET